MVAEPALAKRDEKLRAALSVIVGKSKSKAKAVLSMDGSRSQAAIYKQCGIDKGALSRLVKALRAQALLGDDENPKIVITVPPSFFDDTVKKNG